MQLSKKRINRYIWIRLFTIFSKIFNKKRTQDEFSTLIISIFSYPERIMLIKRIGLIYLILNRCEKYKIVKILHVSKTTIDKYFLIIEKNRKVYTQFIKLIQKEKIFNLLDEIFSTLYGPGTPGIDWKAAWERRRRIEQRKTQGI
jgi:hypothetical protein